MKRRTTEELLAESFLELAQTKRVNKITPEKLFIASPNEHNKEEITIIKEVFTMAEKEQILEAVKKAGEPLNAGKIAELTGLERSA